MIRNLKIECFVRDNDLHAKIRASVRLYRACLRAAFSYCALAETAGAEIVAENGNVTVKPNDEKAREILSACVGHSGKIKYYEMYHWMKELYPSLISNCYSKIQYIIGKMMTMKDQDIKKCQKKFLIVNGKRAFAQFNRSGIPIKSGMAKIDGHLLKCRWDKDIGEVEFTTNKMDSSTYYAFSSLREGWEGWSIKDSYLSFDEDKNKIVVILSYERPDTPTNIEPEKVMHVEFTDDKEMFITCYTDDKWSARPFSAAGIIGYLEEMEQIYSRYWSEFKSYERRERKQRNHVKEKLNRYTERRANAEKNNNHLWSKRIVDFARQQCAGKLVVVNLPEKTLFDLPYGWFDFKTKLDYKMKEIGGTVSFVTVDKDK
ncbi:MAG TPA: hypothetical protein VJ327_10835 [Patescibacteria group bacterium]|nr:hypothetical protein [Patescibacteria group bacterium]